VSDPLACLKLTPDEQVLWHGQPGVHLGVEQRKQIRMWFGAAFVPWLLFLHQAPWGVRLGVAVVVASLVGVGVTLSKLVGGHQLSLGYLLTTGPLLGLLWVGEVSSRGIAGGLDLLREPILLVFMVGWVVAALRVVFAFLRQLHTHYYVTSRRVCEVEAKGAGGKLAWVTPLPTGWLQLRVVRPWGARGRGHIAIGSGARRKLLRWLQQPEATLEDIERAVGGFQERPPTPPARPKVGTPSPQPAPPGAEAPPVAGPEPAPAVPLDTPPAAEAG
jgi:hypothetical protein